MFILFDVLKKVSIYILVNNNKKKAALQAGVFML